MTTILYPGRYVEYELVNYLTKEPVSMRCTGKILRIDPNHESTGSLKTPYLVSNYYNGNCWINGEEIIRVLLQDECLSRGLDWTPIPKKGVKNEKSD